MAAKRTMPTVEDDNRALEDLLTMKVTAIR
jgi:hypothetical protein